MNPEPKDSYNAELYYKNVPNAIWRLLKHGGSNSVCSIAYASLITPFKRSGEIIKLREHP